MSKFYLCGTCKGQSHDDDGNCVNGHDDWLELRDVIHNPSVIISSAKWLGITSGDLVKLLWEGEYADAVKETSNVLTSLPMYDGVKDAVIDTMPASTVYTNIDGDIVLDMSDSNPEDWGTLSLLTGGEVTKDKHPKATHFLFY